TSALAIAGEYKGKIFSTPTPATTVRTVKVAPGSEPCLRAITRPSNGAAVWPSQILILAPAFIFLIISSWIIFLLVAAVSGVQYRLEYFHQLVHRSLHLDVIVAHPQVFCFLDVAFLPQV